VARQIPEDRFSQLIEAATSVFIDQGYRRTQMADVAEALGVAKGTLYLYVESKEALFDQVIRHAGGALPAGLPKEMPVGTPATGSTLRFVREALADRSQLPAITAALQKSRVADVAAEFDAIVREIYQTTYKNRVALKLIDKCAADHPELAALWFETGRQGLMTLLTAYLEDRWRRRSLSPRPDPAIAARIVLETIVFWAVHRHWDPSPQKVDESAVEDTVARLLVAAVHLDQPR
jgi:AcrR family transcriptional regulator